MIHVRILDVGHGNAAIVSSANRVVVIDGGRRQVLLQTLRKLEVGAVDAIFVSHADSDHIGGVLELLAAVDIQIGALYLNTSSKKETKLNRQLCEAVFDRERRYGMLARPGLDTSLGRVAFGNFEIQVHYPTGALATSGPGTSVGGLDVTDNSMSAVLRVLSADQGLVLFCGDMEDDALEYLTQSGAVIEVKYLVFPHHGGLVGSASLEAFARNLTLLCKPQGVVFSTGRGRYGTPRIETVRGVLDANSDCWIACTQLSEHCGAIPDTTNSHLSAVPAYGRSKSHCCAGSIHLMFSKSQQDADPTHAAHQGFVSLVESPLCWRFRMAKT